MPTAIDSLKREHRAIECVLRALNQACAQIAAGERVDPDVLDRYIEFIRIYADKVHHEKEEQILFPALNRCGLPVDAGPIACMLGEHTQGRAYVSRMSLAARGLRQGAPGAADEFCSAAGAFTQLLVQHIQKEDNVLFVIAAGMLGSEGVAALAADFERAERDFSGGRYEELENWARELTSDAELVPAGACSSGCGHGH